MFGKIENVKSVLDGDMSSKTIYNSRGDILFLPFESIEKDLYSFNSSENFINFIQEEINKFNLQNVNAKTLYKVVIREEKKTQIEIFEFLKSKKTSQVDIFKSNLIDFLNN